MGFKKRVVCRSELIWNATLLWLLRDDNHPNEMMRTNKTGFQYVLLIQVFC